MSDSQFRLTGFVVLWACIGGAFLTGDLALLLDWQTPFLFAASVSGGLLLFGQNWVSRVKDQITNGPAKP